MSKNPTPEQALAINTIKSNVSLLAGAGSGKTYVLMKRFVQILRADLSVNPTNIVAITFTRKAADESRGVYARLSVNAWSRRRMIWKDCAGRSICRRWRVRR